MVVETDLSKLPEFEESVSVMMSDCVRKALAGTDTSTKTYVVVFGITVEVDGEGLMPETHELTLDTLTW
jgi:hypothetical protein